MDNKLGVDQLNAQAFINAEVRSLTGHFCSVWQESNQEFPRFVSDYACRDHQRNNIALADTITDIANEMKIQALNSANRDVCRERMLGLAGDFARATLGFEDRHVDLILDHGLFDVVGAFAQQARALDPRISDEDIYQAGRNVMTMNFMQLLLGQQVRLTPSIFAYSLLYPLTDNYLDDPGLSIEEKKAFGVHFRERLLGKSVVPANDAEKHIWHCIDVIEGEFPRDRHPLVHASLIAIHDAQQHSLALLHSADRPDEEDILRLSFEKGGAAVLADGYLVAGDLNAEERLFMFSYGVFTQLIDDLEDTRQDATNHTATVFSQLAGHSPLDAVTNRLFRFGNQVFQSVNYFQGARVATLKEMIWKCIDPLLMDFASQMPRHYSRHYLRKLEKHFPFSFRALKLQRRRLEKKHFQLMDLVRAFARS
jgi:hypothetical protein